MNWRLICMHAQFYWCLLQEYQLVTTSWYRCSTPSHWICVTSNMRSFLIFFFLFLNLWTVSLMRLCMPAWSPVTSGVHIQSVHVVYSIRIVKKVFTFIWVCARKIITMYCLCVVFFSFLVLFVVQYIRV